MKSKLKILGKILLGILIVFIVFAGIVYYKSVNYSVYDVKVDREELLGDLSVEEFSRNVIQEMTFEEKVDQMYGEKISAAGPRLGVNFLLLQRFPHVYVGRNDRLNLPPWVLSDGPRGARVMDQGVDAVTTFPAAMSRGASWNVDLEYRVHDAIAKEMRANKVNYAATPCINLLRHPAWGRAQETYGEDPYLLGVFGVAAVRALQEHNVMACPKHFALNSLENSRFVVDVNLDERTLREVYLPHFKRTVQEANPASMMSAYNKVRGEYSGNNKYLLTDILREEWGFDGFISSDWVDGTYDGPASVSAGLNVEMPFQIAYSYEALQEGIDQGLITEEDIDQLVYESLKTRLAYAVAEDKMEYDRDLILDPSHVALARETAAEGMVLLKNEGVLPFKEEGGSILVIGRLANTENTGDHGSSDSTPPYVITPYQGIKTAAEAMNKEVVLYEGNDLEKAKELARAADEIVIVAGYTFEDEGEYIFMNRDAIEASAEAGKQVGDKGVGGDRETLKLPESDEDLIQAIAGIQKKTALVYVGGSGIDMSDWNDEIPAILFAWYAGMEGGNALADILFGKISPSGKLPFSIAANADDYPFFNPYTNQIDYGYYHGYTLFDKKEIATAYPFGFGLSYSSFEFSDFDLNLGEKELEVSVLVSNTGAVAASEVVQAYVGFANSEVDRPVKLLRAFDKVRLDAGASTVVNLSIPISDLAYYNPERKEWVVEAMEYELFVGNSSSEKDLMQTVFELK